MSHEWQKMIPDALHDAVRAALATALGTAHIDSAMPILGGASGALAFRIDASGRSYCLRVEGKRSVMRNPHQYTCMRIAAQAGIAPHVHYADDRAGISVVDFIEQRSLHQYPGGWSALASALGTMARQLQATAAFPYLTDFRVLLERMLSHLQTLVTPGLLDAHRMGFDRIRAVYPWNPAANVSSHNDINPRNMLFDGHRIWFIDWETAYSNDGLVDVAILCENHAQSPELQQALLCAWYGSPPGRPVLAKLALMKLLTRLYYAGLLIASSGATAGSIGDLSAPSMTEFSARVARGELPAAAPATRMTLGKLYLAAFLAGTHASGFAADLATATEL